MRIGLWVNWHCNAIGAKDESENVSLAPRQLENVPSVTGFPGRDHAKLHIAL